MKFVDEATVYVRAGDGGNGCAAFRREAHVPRGGPSGGDGGDGASVIIRANPQLSTLRDYKYKQHYKAPRGEDGRGKDQNGRAGEDVILPVPVGTLVHDVETGLLADLDTADAEVIVAKGGIGGLGNRHFATPWNQAPREAKPGTAGEERKLRLELKLLADVGIIGLPSVGKSTMIAAISSAKPKIADYPFTTLVPNLGVVHLDSERQLVVADVPGLIEGAADGAGLGHQFLRHIERSGVLIHVVTITPWDDTQNPLQDYDVINRELANHSAEIAKKPQIVVLNKCDITEVADNADHWIEAFAARGVRLLTVSSATREGLTEMLEAAWQARRNDGP